MSTIRNVQQAKKALKRGLADNQYPGYVETEVPYGPVRVYQVGVKDLSELRLNVKALREIGREAGMKVIENPAISRDTSVSAKDADILYFSGNVKPMGELKTQEDLGGVDGRSLSHYYYIEVKEDRVDQLLSFCKREKGGRA